MQQTTLETATQAVHNGPIWSATSEQLNVNLLRLQAGDGIVPHLNNELDVVMVVLAGAGELLIGNEWQPFVAGQIVLVPRGVQRAIRCESGNVVYLTCHQRRGGLMPTFKQ